MKTVITVLFLLIKIVLVFFYGRETVIYEQRRRKQFETAWCGLNKKLAWQAQHQSINAVGESFVTPVIILKANATTSA